MKKKKILIISYYFPPFGGVPVQRTLKFVKYMLEYEWNPVVLTVRDGYDHFHPNDSSLLEKVPARVKVIRTKEIGVIARFIRFLKSKAHTSTDYDVNDKKFAYRIIWLRKLLYNSLWFPDEKNYWIPNAIYAGLRLLSRRDISVIYVSGYPWSAFLVGAFLSKIKKKPLIIDFRDAWTLNPRGLWDNRFQKFWETKVLSQASKVVFATNLIRKGYTERYPWLDKGKFITITNGYDHEDFKYFKDKERKDNKKFLITFTGTFNDNIPPLDIDQSPYYFLKGLSKLLSEKDISKSIRVRFVGNFGDNNKDFVKRLGLGDLVELTGYVSHDKSIEYQMEADLLLLLICPCKGSESILTGKLFEYIGARKPILALVPDGEAKDLIIKERLGITVWPKDIDGIKNAIYELYKDWEQDSLKLKWKDGAYRKYEMKYLTRKLVDIIEEIRNSKASVSF
ncbi:MAG: glycosyltransferase [Candidatus Scalinduaceae bacterium]